jgi:hypothetical protein
MTTSFRKALVNKSFFYIYVAAVLFVLNTVSADPIPEAKPFHFTFAQIKGIGHKRALPFIDSDKSWTINGKEYLKSRSINAFESGIKNNPKLDQTKAINDLILKISKDPDVDTIFFPKGVYYIAGQMYFRPGVNIVGQGQGDTVFERRDLSTYLVTGGGADFKNCVVANLTLSNVQRTLLMKRTGNLSFFHVEFKGGIVRFEDSKNLVFEGNVFNENIGKAGYASSNCSNVHIVNNTFNSVENGSINFSGHENSYAAYNYITSPKLIDSGYAGIRLPNSAKNNIIEYNYVQNHGRGLFVLSYSTGNTFRYNLVDGTTYQGIFVQGPKNIIQGNVIKDAGDEAIYVADGSKTRDVLSVGDFNKVVDNIVYDTKKHDNQRNVGLQIVTENNLAQNNIISVKFGRVCKNIRKDAHNKDIDNKEIK